LLSPQLQFTLFSHAIDKADEQPEAGPSCPSRTQPNNPVLDITGPDAMESGLTHTPPQSPLPTPILTHPTSSRPKTPIQFPLPDPPNAPLPKPLAKDLPTETPMLSHTPTSRQADISEFDPFATPALRIVKPTPLAPTAPEEPTVSVTSEPIRGRVASGSNTPIEPAFNFPGFLKDLRTRTADPVARYLKRQVLISSGRCSLVVLLTYIASYLISPRNPSPSTSRSNLYMISLM
jgi:hypothetical protein